MVTSAVPGQAILSFSFKLHFKFNSHENRVQYTKQLYATTMLVMVVSVVKRDNEPRIDFKAIEGKAAIDNIF